MWLFDRALVLSRHFGKLPSDLSLPGGYRIHAVSVDTFPWYVVGSLCSVISFTIAIPSHNLLQSGPVRTCRIILSTTYRLSPFWQTTSAFFSEYVPSSVGCSSSSLDLMQHRLGFRVSVARWMKTVFSDPSWKINRLLSWTSKTLQDPCFLGEAWLQLSAVYFSAAERKIYGLSW